MKEFIFDEVTLKIFDTRSEMGEQAAKEAAQVMIDLLKKQDEIYCVFGAAPSQDDVLGALSRQEGIDWNRVNAYHMDEYVGLEMGSPQSFSGYLKRTLFTQVPFKNIYYINGMADVKEECKRYSDLLKEHPIDISFLGVGENGHLAFNDPAVADFNDPALMKVVQIDEKCIQQQVNDGCFATMADVPKEALTLTMPALVNVKQVFCVVPTKNKAEAVKNAMTGEVSTTCPASVLRTIKGSKLYIDEDCASLLREMLA